MDVNMTCKGLMENDYDQIYNDLVEMEYDSYSQMTTAQKDELIVKVDNITAAYRSGSRDQFYYFISKYHTDFIDWKLKKY